jgi:peroxiredoxin
MEEMDYNVTPLANEVTIYGNFTIMRYIVVYFYWITYDTPMGSCTINSCLFQDTLEHNIGHLNAIFGLSKRNWMRVS